MAVVLACVASAACNSPAIGERTALDADSAAELAERDGVTIPDGFEFVEGRSHVEFVGQAAWSADFTGPAALGDGKAVAEAKPSFPPLQPLSDCATVPTSVGPATSPCVSGFVSTFPPAGGMDAVTIRLTTRTDAALLSVSSTGH